MGADGEPVHFNFFKNFSAIRILLLHLHFVNIIRKMETEKDTYSLLGSIAYP